MFHLVRWWIASLSGEVVRGLSAAEAVVQLKAGVACHSRQQGSSAWLVSGRSGSGCHSAGRRRGRGRSILGLLQLSLELLTNTGLQCSRRQPLLWQAALKEGHTRAEVGQSVHPAWDLSTTEDLPQTRGRYCEILDSLRQRGPKRLIYICTSFSSPLIVLRNSDCSSCAWGGRRSPYIPSPFPPQFSPHPLL